MEFVEEARERFISLYNKDKLKSLASFAVYGISNNWTYNKLLNVPMTSPHSNMIHTGQE